MAWEPADSFFGMSNDGVAARCTLCDTLLAASDEDTLAYGKLHHDLEHEQPHEGSGTAADPWGLRTLMMAENEESLKATVCCWLIGLYGRPFIFYPADGSPSVMVS